MKLKNQESSITQLTKPFIFDHRAVLVDGFDDVDDMWQWDPHVSSIFFLPLSLTKIHHPDHPIHRQPAISLHRPFLSLSMPPTQFGPPFLNLPALASRRRAAPARPWPVAQKRMAPAPIGPATPPQPLAGPLRPYCHRRKGEHVRMKQVVVLGKQVVVLGIKLQLESMERER